MIDILLLSPREPVANAFPILSHFPFGLDIHPLCRPQSGAAGVHVSWIRGSRLNLSIASLAFYTSSRLTGSWAMSLSLDI